jgi:diguanylate cyclase (GGDEF)-like protein/PAS domain S-box-containing protein
VLIVEDQPFEAEMMARALVKGGYDLAWNRVDTEKEYVAALDTPPDIILSDYHMPQFSGRRALTLLKQRALDIPFILVTGSIGEESAVEMMRLGADDYLLKDRLERLSSAVKKSLRETADRVARRKAEQEVESLREQLKSIVSALPDVVWSAAFPSNRMLYISSAAASVFGWAPADFYEGRVAWRDLIHPEDRPRMMSRWEAAAQSEGYESEYRIVKPGGEVRWIQTRGRCVSDSGGEAVRVDGIARDITERHEQEQKIAHLNRIHAVLSGINAAIVRIRDRRELFHEACRIAVEHGKFGLAWIGTFDPETLEVTPVASVGVEDCGFLMSGNLSLRNDTSEGRGAIARAIRERRAAYINDITHDPGAEGTRRSEASRRGYRSVIALPLMVEGGVAGSFCLFAKEANFFDDEEVRLLGELAGDISFALEHVASQEKLHFLAYYDPLTGLANRVLFLERLAQYMGAVDGKERRLALSIINVERFKTVNDAFGRKVGDALLVQVAGRLVELVVDPDHLARLGADNFAVIVPEVNAEDDLITGLELAHQRIDGDPYVVNGVELRISTRAGVALFPGDGANAETLYQNAEAALKKTSSGERYLFYTRQMTERIAEKLSLEYKLRQALEKNEFVLHYQPKVDLETRRLIGVEALIRWQSPELGLVPPLQFIPLMEETGLILQVGSWALKRASLDHRRWKDQSQRAPRVAVNVSPIQLRQRDFIDVLKQALGDGAVPPGIDLEITETAVMEDFEANTGKLVAVRELGMDIAIDDFGTGYSSLGYLTKLPVQYLKIDRSFIIAMHTDADALALVSTIISLAHSLRLKVVAEGVETEEQAKILRLFGCDEIQGYLISKPVPAAEVEKMLCARAA